MEKISWRDIKTNEEVLQLVQEKKSLMDLIWRRKKNWISHILRCESLLNSTQVPTLCCSFIPCDMISPVGNGSQRLRSAMHENLAVPRTRTVRMGPRSFAVSGPTLWNSLPVELKTAHIPLETFKSKLKTYLFTIAYHQ